MIFSCDLELRAGFDHIGVAVFAEAEDVSVVGPGGGAEAAGVTGDALLAVDFLAGLGVVAEEETGVHEHVDAALIGNRGRVVGAGSRVAPGDVPATQLALGERDVA